MMKKNSVSFYTLGCRLNQSETAVLENTFAASDFEVVDFGRRCDYVVINTCTVTENGDADTRRLVRRINRDNPHTQIALIGCQAQVQKARLTALPGVKWIIGNDQKMETAAIIRRQDRPLEPQVIVPAIRRVPFTVPASTTGQRQTRANIKIQDGCDFFCSFCEIPFARGRARSREFDDILAEASRLSGAGHKELVITGINVGTYAYNGRTILAVVDALSKVPGIERLRISSIEPTTIPEGLLDRMRDTGKLCRYLHIPLQSADDVLLRRMKRKYTRSAFHRFITKARLNVPGICIGTDVIVGFPGETDDRFEQTYRYLLDAPVDYFHVFSYSPRHLARAKRLDGEVKRTVVQQRSARLRELSRRKRRMYFESQLGRVEPVLFEQRKDGAWTGLTDTYVRVRAASDVSLANRLLPVKLCTCDHQTVAGELVKGEEPHE